VRTATVEEVIASIDAAAQRRPGGALAFDGDGTLWSGDIGEDFFTALLAARRIAPAAEEALFREAREHDVDASGTAVDVAHRIHAAYLAERFPEERVCELMTWAFAGWARAEMDAFADGVVAASRLRERLHGETCDVVAWARARGHDVFLVSASPRSIVQAAARIVGIEDANVVAATELRSVEDVVLPAVERPIPYGPGKVTRLRALLGVRALYAAFGDNAFDVAMLREAEVPVAIRPKPRLVARAPEVPGLVTLAPR